MKDITDTVNDVCMVRHLARLCDCCYVTKWVTITSALCPVWYVTVCTGHYYYVRATACPVQIRAHHNIDVHTDINKI